MSLPEHVARNMMSGHTLRDAVVLYMKGQECQWQSWDDPVWPLVWPPCCCTQPDPTPLHIQGTGCSWQGQWIEQIDEDQAILLTPDPSTSEKETRVGPIFICNCSSSPCRAGAEVSGVKNLFRRQKKSKGWMKNSAEPPQQGQLVLLPPADTLQAELPAQGTSHGETRTGTHVRQRQYPREEELRRVTIPTPWAPLLQLPSS